MGNNRETPEEESERLVLERLRGLTEKVLVYAACLGGIFTVRDLTGGTGLKEQEVLEVLKGMMEAGAAKEKNGGRIESHRYPYVYSRDFMFSEVPTNQPTVYTIDFAYIQKRRQFNTAAVILLETIFGTSVGQSPKLSQELASAQLAETERSLESILAALTPLLESVRTARRMSQSQ